MRILCQHLSKTFQTLNDQISALADVNFTVEDNEFVCIVGPSGCGKTTLLKIIAGLQKPSSGQIICDQTNDRGRPLNAMVFQEDSLFPWMTVLDNVAFGLGSKDMGKRERLQRARTFIEKVGLLEFADSYPHELSMGMRQRVGIARAFVTRPYILLMDEPFGSVDAQTRWILQEELLRIWSDHKNLVIFVTHDIEEAVLLGDRVLVLTGRPGGIREEITIPFGRPRKLSNLDRSQIREIKWHIWNLLEDEARKSLGLLPAKTEAHP
jgi:NitT/TauT family transport system ATP-binding protein